MQDRGPDRLLHALKAAGPQTASVLAEKMAITAVAVRQTLERLQSEGLVTFEDIRLSVGARNGTGASLKPVMGAFRTATRVSHWTS